MAKKCVVFAIVCGVARDNCLVCAVIEQLNFAIDHVKVFPSSSVGTINSPFIYLQEAQRDYIYTYKI